MGDSTAPQPTITNPLTDVVGDHVTVSGNTSVPASAVWVNRRPANLAGTSFSATDVLLVLGDNTLHATAVTSDGNISVATSHVKRNPGNDPPIISVVSPLDGTEIVDVTPLLQVSYSDSTTLDPANFRAYLDGIDRTGKFTKSATSATWQVQVDPAALPPVEPLGLGTHVLRVTEVPS